MKIKGKSIEIYPAGQSDAPLILLNNYNSSNGVVYQQCRELGCRDFTLAEISGINWNDEMSPWPSSALQQGEEAFDGKADAYLEILQQDIIPYALEQIQGKPRYIALAGYSMAGLFALYASTRCSSFRSVASCSGSFWYPNFVDYIKSSDPAALPKVVYLSLGDREALTKNEVLSTIGQNTDFIASYLSDLGVHTALEMNKGNHFRQPTLRTAKGIRWILEENEKLSFGE